MAKAVTLKNSNNEEVYPVTDLSLVNGNIPTGRIADNAITTPKIANGAVTSDKIDWTTTGGMKLLATVHLSSFGTSDSNTYQLDLRTLFCNGNSNRVQYFHHILLGLEFYTTVSGNVQSYMRFGKKTSNGSNE